MVLLLTTGISYVIDPRRVQWFVRFPWLEGATVRVLDTAFCSLPSGLLAWAVASLGLCFRVALPERQEHLVTQGIYRWVPNPLALSIDLLSLGLLCVAPSCLAVASCALTMVAYELKILAEERYLRQAHGPAYAAYCGRSGRYIPRVLSKWRNGGAPQ